MSEPLNATEALLQKGNNAINLCNILNDDDGNFSGTRDQVLAMAAVQAQIAIACGLAAILEKMK